MIQLLLSPVCLTKNICTPLFRLTDKYEEASVHLWDLLEGRDKAVVGTTCKSDCLAGNSGHLFVEGCFHHLDVKNVSESVPSCTLSVLISQ